MPGLRDSYSLLFMLTEVLFVSMAILLISTITLSTVGGAPLPPQHGLLGSGLNSFSCISYDILSFSIVSPFNSIKAFIIVSLGAASHFNVFILLPSIYLTHIPLMRLIQNKRAVPPVAR